MAAPRATPGAPFSDLEVLSRAKELVDLDDDLLSHIVRMLPAPSDVLNLRSTSKSFKSLIDAQGTLVGADWAVQTFDLDFWAGNIEFCQARMAAWGRILGAGCTRLIIQAPWLAGNDESIVSALWLPSIKECVARCRNLQELELHQMDGLFVL